MKDRLLEGFGWFILTIFIVWGVLIVINVALGAWKDERYEICYDKYLSSHQTISESEQRFGITKESNAWGMCSDWLQTSRR